MIVVVCINTALVYDHVRKVEKAANKHRLFHRSSSSCMQPVRGNSTVEDEESTRKSARWSLVGRASLTGTLTGSPGRRESGVSWGLGSNSGVPGGGGALSSERALNAEEKSKRRLERMERKSRRTREVAFQSYLYAGSFFFNWAALTVRVYVLSVCFRDSPKQSILTLLGNCFFARQHVSYSM